MDASVRPGHRVRVRITDSLRGNHVRAHAQQNDVGVVVEPNGTVKRLADVYVLVKFANCHIRHRFTAHELERLR